MPLTVAEQTAILTIIQGLLPALPFGVGPQWGRFQAIQYDVDPTSASDTDSTIGRTVNITLLFNCLLPAIFDDAYDTFPQVRPEDPLTTPADHHQHTGHHVRRRPERRYCRMCSRRTRHL